MLRDAGMMGESLVTMNNTFVLADQKWHRQTDSTWSTDFKYPDGSQGSWWTRTIFGPSNQFVGNVAAEWTSAEMPNGQCQDHCLVVCFGQMGKTVRCLTTM